MPRPKPKPIPKAQPPPALESERLDMQLAKAALKKQAAGGKPSREEAAALRRVQKNKEETDRTALLSSIPKVLMEKMTGCSTKTLHNHDRLFGIPLRGETIDLWKALPAYHRVLAQRESREAMDEDGDANHDLSGAKTKNLERYRLARAKNEELTYGERKGMLIHRDKMRRMLHPFAAALERCGNTLASQYGDAARTPFEDALDQLKRLVSTLDEPVTPDDLDPKEDPQPRDAGAPVGVRNRQRKVKA